MTTGTTKVILQSLAVVNASDQPRLPALAPGLLRDGAGNTYWPGNIVPAQQTLSGSTTILSYAPHLENRLVEVTFSSVPVLSQAEITESYRELGDALAELATLDEGSEWKVDAAVCDAACYVAGELMTKPIPAPQVFSHGPKSVVFTWTRGNNSVYLTISADRLSALISTPKKIQRRVEFSARQLQDPGRVFQALLSYRPGLADPSSENVLRAVDGIE
jgi:hypothetical protein